MQNLIVVTNMLGDLGTNCYTVVNTATREAVIIDPAAETEVNADYIRGASDYSCYEGVKLQGKIEKVLLRGNEIVSDGKFLGSRGDGRYLKRGESILAQDPYAGND